MATATLQRKNTYEKLCVEIPRSDIDFFQLLAKKMGWGLEDKNDLLDNYIASRPKNVDLTDEDIMEAVRAVRYAK